MQRYGMGGGWVDQTAQWYRQPRRVTYRRGMAVEPHHSNPHMPLSYPYCSLGAGVYVVHASHTIIPTCLMPPLTPSPLSPPLLRPYAGGQHIIIHTCLSPPLTAALALVGNKTDLWEQREVSEEEGQAYADR